MPDASTVAGGHESPSAGRDPADVARERELARAAAAGDGGAFASLYQTYEKRIYNYCLRLVGGTSDAEDATQEAFLKVFGRLPELDGAQVNFGAYLFTAARNASYDMIERRRRTEPVADLPDDGSGHLHRERADAGVEPERAAMLSAQQAAVRAANERLPTRQREVLALREVEGMSYAEIAATMEMNSNSVAQLISRARTSLRGELRVGVASAVAPASADCERALPLMAMKQDGELSDPVERGWLATHLSDCSGCRLSSEEMAEAGISYRVWAPVAPGLYLFRDTLAKAAESIGADWSAVERPDPVAGSEASNGATSRPSTGPGAGHGALSRPGRRAIATAATTLVVAIGAGIFAGQVADSTIDPADFPEASTVSSPRGEREGGAGAGSGSGSGSGDGQGQAATRATGEPAAQPVVPGTDQSTPAPPAAVDPQPSPRAPDAQDPASPPAGTPGGGGPADGGGGSPVTPPTLPAPTDPPRDPGQPSDPPPSDPPPSDPPPTRPPTGPPVLVPADPKIPPLNPSRPPRIP